MYILMKQNVMYRKRKRAKFPLMNFDNSISFLAYELFDMTLCQFYKQAYLSILTMLYILIKTGFHFYVQGLNML